MANHLQIIQIDEKKLTTRALKQWFAFASFASFTSFYPAPFHDPRCLSRQHILHSAFHSIPFQLEVNQANHTLHRQRPAENSCLLVYMSHHNYSSFPLILVPRLNHSPLLLLFEIKPRFTSLQLFIHWRNSVWIAFSNVFLLKILLRICVVYKCLFGYVCVCVLIYLSPSPLSLTVCVFVLVCRFVIMRVLNETSAIVGNCFIFLIVDSNSLYVTFIISWLVVANHQSPLGFSFSLHTNKLYSPTNNNLKPTKYHRIKCKQSANSSNQGQLG